MQVVKVDHRHAVMMMPDGSWSAAIPEREGGDYWRLYSQARLVVDMHTGLVTKNLSGVTRVPAIVVHDELLARERPVIPIEVAVRGVVLSTSWGLGGWWCAFHRDKVSELDLVLLEQGLQDAILAELLEQACAQLASD